MNSRIDGLTTMLQIRTVTMLAARDSGVNTCNLRRSGFNGSGNGDWGRFVPDESEVVFDLRVRRVDGQILRISGHLSFTLVVVDRGKGGRGMSMVC